MNLPASKKSLALAAVGAPFVLVGTVAAMLALVEAYRWVLFGVAYYHAPDMLFFLGVITASIGAMFTVPLTVELED